MEGERERHWRWQRLASLTLIQARVREEGWQRENEVRVWMQSKTKGEGERIESLLITMPAAAVAAAAAAGLPAVAA